MARNHSLVQSGRHARPAEPGYGDLKQQALRLGGNAVYVFSETVSAGGGVAEMSAIVYRCPSRGW